MVEIFSDGLEITNRIPLITPEFIDEYQSRNDTLADLMRRLGICEEKGSGIDKVISYNEISTSAQEILIQEAYQSNYVFL
jgi:predicted HTH transcriptional regulator